MIELLNALKETSLPTILVVSGILFLLLSVSGGLSGKLSIPQPRQKFTALIGSILVAMGIFIYAMPIEKIVIPEDKHDGVETGNGPADKASESNDNSAGSEEDWQEIGNDSFFTDKKTWKTNSFENGGGKFETKIISGNYRWEALFVQSWWQTRFSEYEPVSDFYAAVDLRFNSNPDNNLAAGIIFRSSYNKNYRLMLIGNKYYILEYIDVNNKENNKVLIDWTYIPNIDMTNFNRIAVQAVGPTIKVFINGKFRGEVSDSTQTIGNIGFILYNFKKDGLSAEVDFDNFELRVKK